MTGRPTKKITISYGDLSGQLETIMIKLQDPDVPVDDMVRYYEQAMKLISQLAAQLEHAENRVQTIRARYTGE